MRLLAQVSHGPRDTLELYILFPHDLYLLLMLPRRQRILALCNVIVVIADKSTVVWMYRRRFFSVVHLLLHILDLPRRFLNKPSASSNIGNIESVLVGILFDGSYGGGEVREVVGE
jgi:hypothetical protein